MRHRVVRRSLALALLLGWVPVGACQLVFPTELGPGTEDGSTKPDRTTSSDVTPEATRPGDVADSAVLDAGPTVYHDMTSREFWSTYDTTRVNVTALGYAGAAFDGRNLYLAPEWTQTAALSPNSTVARYDTLGVFTDTPSWTAFNVNTVSSTAQGFAGAVFDGHYLYFAPYTQEFLLLPNTVARYDTTRSFGAQDSWSTFDTQSLVDGGEAGLFSGAAGFYGATFDGRYIYLVPNSSGSFFPSGTEIALRYDTKASFGEQSSWSTFDTSTVSGSVDAGGESFCGAVFDGQYIYLVPNPSNDGPAFPPIVVRYDTHQSFEVQASWSAFDVGSLLGPDAGLTDFLGGAFDGRYVYFVPELSGLVVRYDTQSGDFAAPSSWSSFDTACMDAGFFAGATFDGRYVYFAGTPVVRYDTTAAFAGVASWSTFDVSTLVDGANIIFIGAVFDGRSVYFVPNTGPSGTSGLVFRFDDKSPPSMPKLPAFHGSFL